VGAHQLIRALGLGLLLFAGCAAEDTLVISGGEAGHVASIADGDTLRLADGRRIRLVQIDAPEPGSECFGNDAERELARLAPPGSDVELERDPALDERDRFGRLLRYVSVGGENVNVALVERGAAAPYFFRGDRGRYADRLLDAAEAAEAAERGLWGACPAARLQPSRTLAAGPPMD
jgi:endonuclease YncB( thermonuclease family)